MKIKTGRKATNLLRKIEGFFFFDLFKTKNYMWHRVRSHIYKNLINVISSSIFKYKCVEISYKIFLCEMVKNVENIKKVVVKNQHIIYRKTISTITASAISFCKKVNFLKFTEFHPPPPQFIYRIQ